MVENEQVLEAWNNIKSVISCITTQQLDDLAKEYRSKYAEYEESNRKSKALFHEAEHIEAKMIAAMTEAGKQKYYVEGIGMFYFSNKFSVKTPKTIADKKAFFLYLLDTHGEIFYWDKVSVNSATLQKIFYEDQKAATEKGALDFKIPGLEAPTAMTSLNFRCEKK